MQIMKKLKNKSFFRQIYFALLLLIAVSCSQKKSHETHVAEKVNRIMPPVVVAAGAPFVVRLDTCPRPDHIIIPTRDSIDHVYYTSKGPSHITLGPPQIKPSDFFINMPVYDVPKRPESNFITCSFQDKRGNFWFGTREGITRYDGRTSVTFNNAQMFTNHYPSDRFNWILNITEDKNGNLWFAMRDHGIIKYACCQWK